MSLLNVNVNRVKSAFNVVKLVDAIVLVDVTDFSLQQDIRHLVRVLTPAPTGDNHARQFLFLFNVLNHLICRNGQANCFNISRVLELHFRLEQN